MRIALILLAAGALTAPAAWGGGAADGGSRGASDASDTGKANGAGGKTATQPPPPRVSPSDSGKDDISAGKKTAVDQIKSSGSTDENQDVSSPQPTPRTTTPSSTSEDTRPDEPVGNDGTLTQGGERAYSRAQRAAELLKAGLPSDVGDAAVGVRSIPGAQPGKIGGPADPRGVQDLALSAMGGYGQVFQDMGLRIAHGSSGELQILTKNGRLASPQLVDALRARILAEPAALARYPGFYGSISREDFGALKDSYQQPEARMSPAFKDIGMTESARDFNWTRSCSKVSGDCNEAAKSDHYKKDDLVRPEDLEAVWKDIEKAGDERKEREAAQALAPKLGSASSRIGALLSGISGWLAQTFGYSSSGSVSDSAVAIGSGGERAHGAPVSFSTSQKKAAATVPAPAPSEPAPSRARVLIELASALVGALLLWFGWRRNSRGMKT